MDFLFGLVVGVISFGVVLFTYTYIQSKSHDNDITVEQVTEYLKDKVGEWGEWYKPTEEIVDNDLSEMDGDVPLVARVKKQAQPSAVNDAEIRRRAATTKD